MQNKEPFALSLAAPNAPDDSGGREQLAKVAKRDGLGLGTPSGDAFRAEVRRTLLASARHELRSPIQSIQGFAELLQTESYGRLSSDQHTFLEHILQSSTDLANSVDMCFELAQHEVLGVTPQLERVEVGQALRAALETHHDSAPDDHCTLLTPNSLFYARLDPALFSRAVCAVLNALHPFGPIVLSLAPDESLLAVCFEPQISQVVGAMPPAEPNMDTEVLITQGRPAKGLLSLRLASVLLTPMGATLHVSPRQERARVGLLVC